MFIYVIIIQILFLHRILHSRVDLFVGDLPPSVPYTGDEVSEPSPDESE